MRINWKAIGVIAVLGVGVLLTAPEAAADPPRGRQEARGVRQHRGPNRYKRHPGPARARPGAATRRSSKRGKATRERDRRRAHSRYGRNAQWRRDRDTRPSRARVRVVPRHRLDTDGDGVPNFRDRYPRDPRRR